MVCANRSADNLRLDRRDEERVGASGRRRCRQGIQYRAAGDESSDWGVRLRQASRGRTGVDDSRFGHATVPDREVRFDGTKVQLRVSHTSKRIVDGHIFWRDAASAQEDEMSFKFAA